MTNIDITNNIPIDGTETEKVTNNKYLGQKLGMENRTREKGLIRIKARRSVFWKVQKTNE